jgi:methionyl-tRNA synthetase
MQPEETLETPEVEEVQDKQDRKATISYDDFMKLDIAIGTIVSAEVVEGADKLLRLMVDTGDCNDAGEAVPRQIISGIREYFEDVQFLVGKQCPFLINLQPRTIRGYESQGMILAAEHDGVFAMLIPHNELPSGTRVN